MFTTKKITVLKEDSPMFHTFHVHRCQSKPYHATVKKRVSWTVMYFFPYNFAFYQVMASRRSFLTWWSAFKWLVGAEMALIFLINGAEQSRVALYKKGSSHCDGFAVFAWNTCHTFNLGIGLVHLTSRVRLTHKWDEFWNMHLLMTKYDHPGMTQCSWQDIEIQLLT